ncbi:hypothetical protein [Paenibacillus terrae]|uniref:hypothetical protein n=1 Tax=Paenibacillus terrae TaxID=159743 RepID=UPI0021CCB523|nr:hypothetical protein [Paenibacillus terrae]
MSIREELERLAIRLPDDTLEALHVHNKEQSIREFQFRLLSGQELVGVMEWVAQFVVLKPIVSELDSLIPYLDDEDMYVQERDVPFWDITGMSQQPID